jgi:hypothetical protein
MPTAYVIKRKTDGQWLQSLNRAVGVTKGSGAAVFTPHVNEAWLLSDRLLAKYVAGECLADCQEALAFYTSKTWEGMSAFDKGVQGNHKAGGIAMMIFDSWKDARLFVQRFPNASYTMEELEDGIGVTML